MRDIAVIGAGDFGREVALLIKQINKIVPTWNLLGFYDDNAPIGKLVYHLPILGKVADVNNVTSELSIAVAIANPHIRKAIVEKLDNSLLHFPTLVYPGCELGDEENTFGKGCLITCGCIFTVNIQVGDFVIFNLGTTIGHDSTIGSYSSFMPNCNISGGAAIGSACYFGTGSTILQNLTVGEGSIVGAGAVVTKSAGVKSKLIGVPATNRNAAN